MKALSILAAILVVLPARPAPAEMENNEIPLGIEAVTGVRSDYLYRGFNLAGAVMDFQVESELTLGRDFYLDLGGWFATETSGPFAELSGFADLRRDLSQRFSIGATLTYRSFHESFFESGFDLGPYLNFFPAKDWSITLEAYRDFGAEAWYANAEAGWSRRLTDDAFLSLRGGLSAVEKYYGRSGFNDLHGRAALTYNLNRMISLTPFIGGSLELLDGDGNELIGGLWFEVSF